MAVVATAEHPPVVGLRGGDAGAVLLEGRMDVDVREVDGRRVVFG